jgi:hypothetical protein
MFDDIDLTRLGIYLMLVGMAGIYYMVLMTDRRIK